MSAVSPFSGWRMDRLIEPDSLAIELAFAAQNDRLHRLWRVLRRIKKVSALLLASLWLITGCGIVYTAVDVESGLASGINVTLVQMTPTTIDGANSSPYEPPRLPAAFDLSAGVGSRGGFQSLPEGMPLPENAAPGPYLIGPGDVLSLRSDPGAQDPQLILPVRDNGAIELPRVGMLPVAGLTVERANTALSDLLEERRMDPVLTLEVEEFRARFVLVDGDVESPGRVGLDARAITLDEAIISRGGGGASQAGSVALLFRNTEVYTIPLSDRRVSASLYLRDGDRIHVTGANDLDRLEAERGQFEARLALDAVERPAVFIAGEVQSPRRVSLPFNRIARLADVVFDQGGMPLRTSDYAAIYVLRLGSDPSRVTAYELDAGNAAHLLMATRFQLRPDDLIFVAEQKVTRINRILSQFTPALGVAARNGITTGQGG